jgi:predicted dehydrogenase
LEYPTAEQTPDDVLRQHRVTLRTVRGSSSVDAPRLAFIGSGNYATGVLIPAFKSARARLQTVASSTGVTAMHAGRKFKFAEASTDSGAIFQDASVDAVVITTRHDSHAGLVLRALDAGKRVFVEKPLCLTLEELAEIESAYGRALNPLLMVGFNRRFAPQMQKMKMLLAATAAPKSFVMTVNAGAIASDHWTQDRTVGGGRIIGEACHFIDLLRFLADSPIVRHERTVMDSTSGDTLTIQLRFADGSIGAIHYFANGSKAFPKERLEVFTQGRVLQLDNFKKLTAFGWPGFTRMNLWQQDKGQKACAAAFLAAVRNGGPSPIPFDEIVEVSRTTIALGS